MAKPPKYAKCKGTRTHQWFLSDVERGSSFGTPTWHKCELCDTIRITIIDRRGNIASRYYKHPKDYKAAGTFTAADYRLLELKEYRARRRALTKV